MLNRRQTSLSQNEIAMDLLKAPFPYFGGKIRVASIIWSRFGNVVNYVEPFFGSGAVLLSRPDPQGIETINDKDGMVANFWRAIQHDAQAVASFADWPANENDLHARHKWLIGQRESLQIALESDPDYYDAKIAGWWCWGLCLWIGSGFCSVPSRKLIHLGAGKGVHRRLIHLGNAGKGVHRKRIHLGHAGKGLYEWFAALQERFRRVRVCSGDWSRIMGPSPTVKNGLTGIFLDPPYGFEQRSQVYAEESFAVASDCLEWCVENGDNPLLRIALCGYQEEHGILSEMGWSVYGWSAQGGYAGLGKGLTQGKENKHQERIWFSPHCLSANQLTLF